MSTLGRPLSPILSRKRLIKLLDVSPATLTRMDVRGELPPAIKLSPGRKGWREDDIATWLASRTEAR
jgi:predicted DNA-binding transcriptional regulator AlpA